MIEDISERLFIPFIFEEGISDNILLIKRKYKTNVNVSFRLYKYMLYLLELP